MAFQKWLTRQGEKWHFHIGHFDWLSHGWEAKEKWREREKEKKRRRNDFYSRVDKIAMTLYNVSPYHVVFSLLFLFPFLSLSPCTSSNRDVSMINVLLLLFNITLDSCICLPLLYKRPKNWLQLYQYFCLLVDVVVVAVAVVVKPECHVELSIVYGVDVTFWSSCMYTDKKWKGMVQYSALVLTEGK